MLRRQPQGAAAVLLLVLASIALAACGGSTQTSPSPATSGPVGTGGPSACAATPEPASEAVSAWTGDQSASLFPSIIDPGVLACGENRFVFSFLDTATNAPAASPDIAVRVVLFDLGANADTPAATVDAEFIWAIPDSVGIYIATVDFPTFGLWGAEFQTTRDGATESIRFAFDVRETRTVVSVGDAAPSVDTPTLADVDGDVTRISTDDDPIAAFYETSVADALAAKEPFVLVFATPKFCASAQCGPTLDRIKPIAAAHPDVTFINVEPYLLEDVEGQLQPVLTNDQLTPAEATNAWRLPSEPWVFVVDGNGIVTGSFMLIFGDAELDSAVAAVE